jgi:hypothetical protein
MTDPRTERVTAAELKKLIYETNNSFKHRRIVQRVSFSMLQEKAYLLYDQRARETSIQELRVWAASCALSEVKRRLLVDKTEPKINYYRIGSDVFFGRDRYVGRSYPELQVIESFRWTLPYENRSLSDLKRIASQGAKDPEFHVTMGNAFMTDSAFRNLNSAITAFERAISLDSSYAAPWYSLALIQIWQRDKSVKYRDAYDKKAKNCLSQFLDRLSTSAREDEYTKFIVKIIR